jgi:hypothetical protein
MSKKIITFDESAKKELLSALGKTVDKEGFITERKTSQRVLTRDGEEIKASEFAAYKKGSEIFVKKDLISLIKFYDSIK